MDQTSRAPARRGKIAALLTLLMALTGLAATVPAQAVTTEAIRDLAICTQQEIPRNDDGSSLEIDLPFAIDFFGTRHESLFVNNNGNITFDRSLSQFTPEDLTGATGNAMIAPFFADVDTRADGSQLVTYGGDDTTFCANWVGVGYYDSNADKLISAQLIITDRSEATGNAGDVALEFNYSDVEWETGDFSGGEDGLGGTSVAVGYTAGTGEEGTYTQLPGSLTNGALIDGGPNALTAGLRNSNVNGRYVFNIGGEDLVQEGNLVGTVTDESEAPLEGIEIEACRDGGERCETTTTSATGAYSIAGLPVGEYVVTAVAPQGSELRDSSAVSEIFAGQTSELDLVMLPATYGELTVTVVDLGDAAVSGAAVELCVAGTDDCAVTGESDEQGQFSAEDLLTDEYDVVVTAPEGSRLRNGAATVSVVEDELATVTVVLLPAIDRSVVVEVVDQDGAPIAGADVTIAAQDGDDWQALDPASPLLGADSANPATTDDDGTAGWDVAESTYRISAEAEGCAAASAITEGFDEGGEALLQVTLDCVVAEAPTDPGTPPTDTATPPAGELPSTGGDLSPLPAAAMLLIGGTLALRARRSALG